MRFWAASLSKTSVFPHRRQATPRQILSFFRESAAIDWRGARSYLPSFSHGIISITYACSLPHLSPPALR
jgi:hypothetical protein